MTTTLPEGPEALLGGQFRAYFTVGDRELCAAADMEWDGDVWEPRGGVDVVNTDPNAIVGGVWHYSPREFFSVFGQETAHKVLADMAEQAAASAGEERMW